MSGAPPGHSRRNTGPGSGSEGRMQSTLRSTATEDGNEECGRRSRRRRGAERKPFRTKAISSHSQAIYKPTTSHPQATPMRPSCVPHASLMRPSSHPRARFIALWAGLSAEPLDSQVPTFLREVLRFGLVPAEQPSGTERAVPMRACGHIFAVQPECARPRAQQALNPPAPSKVPRRHCFWTLQRPGTGALRLKHASMLVVRKRCARSLPNPSLRLACRRPES